jgi:hypothetical protein
MDPYELLGVPHGAAPEAVRSAHDRLAAGCDPNLARRLREARDAVLHDLELLTILDSPLALELPPGPARPPEVPVPDDFDLSEALQATPTMTIRLTAETLWQLALAGHDADAYRGLVILVEQQDESEDVYLRLYWLLMLRPDLEAARAPAQWLVRGLHAVGVGGSLWELYRRLLAEDAHEALSPRCAELLAVPAEPDHLVEVVQLRWRAAADAQRWDIISSDLDVLRQHLPAANTGVWARVWAAALDHLIWSDEKVPRKLGAHCYQAQGEIPSDHFAVAEARKHANSLRDLAAGWRKLRSEPDVPPPLLALIPLSWCRPFPEVRPKLLAFLADALRTPRSFLRALDATREQPAVLAHFVGLLERLQATLPPLPLEARSSSDLADLTLAFLDVTDRSYYRNFRPLLLDFCLREAIGPQLVAELIERNPHYWLSPDRHLSEAVRTDEPLRLVYLAHELFWV